MRIPRKRWLYAAAITVALLSAAAGCSCSSSSTNGNAVEVQQQNKQDLQYAFTQPLPYFPFSQIRQTKIEVEAIDALGIASTTFMFVPGIPNPVLVCPSIGVPIPTDDQLSPPSSPAWNGRGGQGNVNNSDAGVPQELQEPFGLFAGPSSGTDSLCVNGTGGQYDGYNEAYDVSVTAPAYWDPNYWGPGKGYIKITGAVIMPKCSVQSYSTTDSAGNATKAYEEVCTDPAKPKPAAIPTPPVPSPTSS